MFAPAYAIHHGRVGDLCLKKNTRKKHYIIIGFLMIFGECGNILNKILRCF